MNLESRQKYLLELRNYIEDVDNEVTIILQSLQWNKNTLLGPSKTATCKFDSKHIMPIEKLRQHEEKCYFRSKGYSEEDILLPEPLDPTAPTVVKLDPESISNIIENAAKCDPFFKRGHRNKTMPLTSERLQATYTSDEKRAIYDAVLSMAPSPQDTSDLTMLSDEKGTKTVQKSREQVLAELRDMKRRRMKYRNSAPTRNYSHELRQVISAQMELYTEAQAKVIKTEENKTDNVQNVRRPEKELSRHSYKDKRNDYKDNYKRKNKRDDECYRKDSTTNKRYDNYDDERRHRYHSYKSERDSYSSSSRNGKRQNEQYERNDHRSEKTHYYKARENDYKRYNDKSNKYDRYREYVREKKYRDY